MADLSEGDIARRRAGKRFNERLKLAATFVNTTGIATMVGTLIIPALQDITKVAPQQWASIPGALGLHLIAQVVLSFFKSED